MLYNIDTLGAQGTLAESKLERKDVWSVKWAEVRPCLVLNGPRFGVTMLC